MTYRSLDDYSADGFHGYNADACRQYAEAHSRRDIEEDGSCLCVNGWRSTPRDTWEKCPCGLNGPHPECLDEYEYQYDCDAEDAEAERLRKYVEEPEAAQAAAEEADPNFHTLVAPIDYPAKTRTHIREEWDEIVCVEWERLEAVDFEINTGEFPAMFDYEEMRVCWWYKSGDTLDGGVCHSQTDECMSREKARAIWKDLVSKGFTRGSYTPTD